MGAMDQELKVCVGWWRTQLAKSKLPERTLAAFERNLFSELFNRYNGHWHPESPIKGSGYRSITYDVRMDPCLSRAAVLTGITNEHLEHCLNSCRFRMMFVNPGEVKMHDSDTNTPLRVLYKAGEHEVKETLSRPVRQSTPPPQNNRRLSENPNDLQNMGPAVADMGNMNLGMFNNGQMNGGGGGTYGYGYGHEPNHHASGFPPPHNQNNLMGYGFNNHVPQGHHQNMGNARGNVNVRGGRSAGMPASGRAQKFFPRH